MFLILYSNDLKKNHMKNNLILSVPTAKIQIGNKAAITLDTATTNGKKSFQISIMTENDTVNKIIDDISEEVNNKMETSIADIGKDSKSEFYESQVEIERVKSESFANNVGIFIPIIAILAIFGFMAFSSYQKRKWREALLNKGFNLDEINKSEIESKLKLNSEQDELASYDKRKTLKYSIVFGSIGLAILMGTIMSEPGYFFGMLFMLLGAGFWFYNQKIK